MFQVRIHGRGGQGVVTGAELLSLAAFAEGRHAQAFPTFGSERTGAPVTAFCRIDDRQIRLRDPIAEPDAVVVQDPTLLHQLGVFTGLRPGGYALVNSARGASELGLDDVLGRLGPERLLTVPATEIAREHVGRPLPNVPLLAALATLTGVVTLDSVVAAIRERFAGATGEANVAAALAAAERTRDLLGEVTHA